MSRSRFEGKVALVTGAAGGIGSALSRAFAREGASLGLLDQNGARLDELATGLDALGASSVSAVGDVSTGEAAGELADQLNERFGGIDVVVNCAGKISALTVEQTTDAVWDDLQAVNSTGAFLTVRAALPFMRGRDGASIVSVSSMGGLLGAPQLVAYSAAKSAILGMTRALAIELAPDNIRVNAVCPGSVDTEMPRAFQANLPEGADAEAMFWGRQLIKRFGTPEEISNVILFLASDESSFITGGVIPVDGGWTAW